VGREVLESKVDADGGDVALFELVVCEPAEDGGFADRGGSYDDELEDVVVAFLHVNLIIICRIILILKDWIYTSKQDLSD
jgi:hypothetical protein